MEYTEDDWKLHGLVIETDYAPNGHVIAVMNGVGDKVEADGNLISAAPDMYKELKSAVEILRKVHRYQDDMPVLKPMIQALAKAEGKA